MRPQQLLQKNYQLSDYTKDIQTIKSTMSEHIHFLIKEYWQQRCVKKRRREIRNAAFSMAALILLNNRF